MYSVRDVFKYFKLTIFYTHNINMSLTVAEIERQLQKNYPSYEKLQIESLRDYLSGLNR